MKWQSGHLRKVSESPGSESDNNENNHTNDLSDGKENESEITVFVLTLTVCDFCQKFEPKSIILLYYNTLCLNCWPQRTTFNASDAIWKQYAVLKAANEVYLLNRVLFSNNNSKDLSRFERLRYGLNWIWVPCSFSLFSCHILENLKRHLQPFTKGRRWVRILDLANIMTPFSPFSYYFWRI